jgi:multiple sugar transport system ATP-binding protein
MGSPAINLLTARVDGDTLHSPLGDVPLDGPLRDAVGRAAHDGTVIVGLRPEHLNDAALGEPHGENTVSFSREVNVLEAMGAEYYAYFDLPNEQAIAKVSAAAADGDGDPVVRSGTELIARLPVDSKVREREPISLWFDAGRLHVFDPQSGARV